MSDRIDYRYNAEERVKLALSLPQSENEVPALVVAQIATAEAVLALVDATRAADTIDALVKEMHARELHHFEEEQNAAGLAAVVEKVREWSERWPDDPKADFQSLLSILSTTPADALAEHDARLIEGLAEKWDWDAVPAAAPPVRFWLESQASLIREGAQP